MRKHSLSMGELVVLARELSLSMGKHGGDDPYMGKPIIIEGRLCRIEEYVAAVELELVIRTELAAVDHSRDQLRYVLALDTANIQAVRDGVETSSRFGIPIQQ